MEGLARVDGAGWGIKHATKCPASSQFARLVVAQVLKLCLRIADVLRGYALALFNGRNAEVQQRCMAHHGDINHRENIVARQLFK